MFFVFQLIMIIVMFNVLIAIVSDVYNDVKETAEVAVIQHEFVFCPPLKL